MSDDELRGEMRRTVADFLKAESGPQERRTAMQSEYGYDRAVFERAMTELGLGGLVVGEHLGGLGLGFAESAAAAQSCLEGTVGYLKVREQFGRAIGSFQALKHRCADLAVAVRGAQATAEHAVEFAASGQRVDELGDPLSTVAALAKTVCSDTLMRVAADCLQLHGGVGFTFEHDLHLYLKRAKANQLLTGSPSRLREQLTRRVLPV